jgi:hypothetical protein
MNIPGTVERAFELARSGSCPTMLDIKKQLKREQHSSVDMHLQGSLVKQLREVCRQRTEFLQSPRKSAEYEAANAPK